MATNKNSFVLYADLINVVGLLSDEQAGKLFRTILEYVNDKNPEQAEPMVKLAFEPIKHQLKRDLRTWEARREKRVESGRLGGIKSGESRRHEANEPTASNSKQNEANEAVTVNGTVTVNVKREAFAPPTKEDVCEEMKKKLDEFTSMAQAERFVDYYSSKGWVVGKTKMKDWKSAVRNWLRNIKEFTPKKEERVVSSPTLKTINGLY